MSSMTFGSQFGISPLLDIRARLTAQLEAQRLQLAAIQARPRLPLAPRPRPADMRSQPPAGAQFVRRVTPQPSRQARVPVPREVPDDNVPAWLRCPITFELIQDPVFSRVSGRTYSRAAILRWLRGTSLTDPMTNTRCTERDLFDNLAMREELDHFAAQNSQTACD